MNFCFLFEFFFGGWGWGVGRADLIAAFWGVLS